MTKTQILSSSFNTRFKKLQGALMPLVIPEVQKREFT
jgi:hypothetical protein